MSKNQESKGVKDLVNSIKENAKTINQREYKKLDKNQSVKIPSESWKNRYIGNSNIKAISVNNESNTISLNLYNAFVMAVMTDIYGVNMSEVKQQLNSVAEYMVYNRMLSKELANNPEPFLLVL